MDVSKRECELIGEIVGDFLASANKMLERGDFMDQTNRKFNALRVMLYGFEQGETVISDFQQETLFEVMCFALDRLTLMEAYGDLSENGQVKLNEKRMIMERLLGELQKPEKHTRLYFVSRAIFLAPAELVRMGLLRVIPESQRLLLLDRYRKDSHKGRLAWISQYFHDRLTARTH